MSGLAIRELNIVSYSVSAGVEREITIPYDIGYIEIIAITATDSRFSWESGGTASGGNYIPLNPDWWSPEGISIPSGEKFYLYSSVDNAFIVHYGKR